MGFYHISQEQIDYIGSMKNEDVFAYMNDLERKLDGPVEKVKLGISGLGSMAAAFSPAVAHVLGNTNAEFFCYVLCSPLGLAAGLCFGYKLAHMLEIYPTNLQYAGREIHKRRLEGRLQLHEEIQ